MSSLVADLKHTQEFLEGQRKLLAPDQFRVIVGKQSSTWCSRFRSSKLSPSDCATVTGILASGPWNEEQKGALGNALSESMMGTEGPAPRRPAQELKSFPCYITPNDAKVLRSDVRNMVKLSCVVRGSLRQLVLAPSQHRHSEAHRWVHGGRCIYIYI